MCSFINFEITVGPFVLVKTSTTSDLIFWNFRIFKFLSYLRARNIYSHELIRITDVFKQRVKYLSLKPLLENRKERHIGGIKDTKFEFKSSSYFS